MCGIVGGVASRDIVPVLVEGLRRLEYRGYDSCGVAVHRQGELVRSRSTLSLCWISGWSTSQRFGCCGCACMRRVVPAHR